MAFFDFATPWRRRDRESVRPATLFVPAPASPVARLALFVAAGSAQDGRAGAAHMLEHLVFDQHLRLGWSDRPTSQIDALTSWFWTCYCWDGAATDLDEALNHFAALVSIPPLDQALFDHHRRILDLELRQRLAGEPLLGPRMALDVQALAGSGFDAPPLASPKALPP
jgi:predicted Zn-dependent peptidase